DKGAKEKLLPVLSSRQLSIQKQYQEIRELRYEYIGPCCISNSRVIRESSNQFLPKNIGIRRTRPNAQRIPTLAPLSTRMPALFPEPRALGSKKRFSVEATNPNTKLTERFPK